MTKVFQRQIGARLPLAVRGEGVYVIDSNGKRYLDASGGAAVSCLGHSDIDVIKATQNQLNSLPFAHSAFFSSEPAEDLADFLIKASPKGITAAYFVSGGSEGIEAALKMVKQYFIEIGQPNRTRFIARRQSYHGNTLGALAVGGNIWRREPYKEILMDATHVSPCYAYREKLKTESDKEYGMRLAYELEETILELGPENVAAFIAETIGGATAGVIPPVNGYFKLIRKICDKFGVILILDEVMCGMGRAGTLFACEQEGVSPDIIVVAKGLGAGYQPIGAALVGSKIFNAFKRGSGVFLHGHTYMGHPTACAAALAVQRKICENNVLSNVNRASKKLFELLGQAFRDHPYIGDIRGRGLFIGLELVADKNKKIPFDHNLKIHAKIRAKGMENGLISYPSGGTVDGQSGDHILIAPPFIIEENQISELVEKLERTINEVTGLT